jgi:hypothetical protein
VKNQKIIIEPTEVTTPPLNHTKISEIRNKKGEETYVSSPHIDGKYHPPLLVVAVQSNNY